VSKSPVTRWRYWQGIGLAIHRSWVRVLAGHHRTVTLDKLLAPVCFCQQQYNLVPAKKVISLAGKVTAGLVESNGSYTAGLKTKKRGSATWQTLVNQLWDCRVQAVVHVPVTVILYCKPLAFASSRLGVRCYHSQPIGFSAQLAELFI